MSYAHLLPDFVRSPTPDIYGYGRPLFLDFETTNLDNGSALNPHNRIVLATWQLGWDGELCLRRGSEYEQDDLMRAIEVSDFVVAHNAKFELQWLARCGLDLHDVLVYDTMLAEYVIGGNRWVMQHLSLDNILARRKMEGKVSLVSKMIKAGVCPSEIPNDWLDRYAMQDVRAMMKLCRAQLSDMRGSRLLPVVYSRCLLTPVLADVETVGMRLDAERVEEAYSTAKEKLERLTSQLNLLTGGIKLQGPQLEKYVYDTLEFAERKVKKGREWVPLRTDTGRRSTDMDTLLALKATTPKQAEFQSLYIQANAARQLMTKYLSKFHDCCNDAEGLLYANFNQTNTQTHRLSSTGRAYSAQFQNFPRALKPLFRSRYDNHLVGEVDGAQLEFRIAAHLGRCDAALADIEANVDVHSYTAEVLTNAGQNTNRQDAKEHTFKPLYFGQSGTDAERTYYRAFREKYPGITKTQRAWIEQVLEHKFLETEWGLCYYWPDTRMDRSGYVTNSTNICNYPVQAFATAEIIPLAMVMMWHVIHEAKFEIRLMNTVHDSIIADVAPDAVEDWHHVSEWALIEGVYDMVANLYGIHLLCRLGCGVKVATNWGDTKEETKYEADETLYRGEENANKRKSGGTVCASVADGARRDPAALVQAGRRQEVLPYRGASCAAGERLG